MTATVFATPEGFREPPDLSDYFKEDGFGLNLEALRKAEEEWLEELRQWCKANTDSKSDLVGESIFIPWADGAAQYMVFRTQPLQLLHVPLGDAWNVPEYMTRGLTGKDIREMVQREKGLAKLFGRG